MSSKLFQCLSPAGKEDQVEEAVAPVVASAESPRSPAAKPRGSRGKQRRSRSAMAIFLSLFRSEPTAGKVSSSSSQQQPQPAVSPLPPTSSAEAPTEAGKRRRRRSKRPSSSGTTMRPKRDRCPKCHGVLPVTSPELPPVLVRPGQSRCRREYKEDSGCIMTERSAGGHSGDGQRSGRTPGSQEDSGNFSSSSLGNNAARPELPHQLPGFYSRRIEYNTCVPRLPNRDAPINCVPIRG